VVGHPDHLVVRRAGRAGRYAPPRPRRRHRRLTSTCWRNDHNGFSHQGPGLIDTAIPLAPGVVRIWLPPDANTTLSIADHCLRSRDHVNLIVVDKQPHLQDLTLDEANAHCAAGASVWQ
jgi:xylulose-5-phosphate/fructose-6-phosphate phosphoketolase